MLSLQNMIIAVGLALVVGFGGGWRVHSWKSESEAMTIAKAAGEVERIISSSLEKQLADLKANQEAIQHETKTIIERPVYRNVCLDIDGVRNINAAKGGAAKPSS